MWSGFMQLPINSHRQSGGNLDAWPARPKTTQAFLLDLVERVGSVDVLVDQTGGLARMGNTQAHPDGLRGGSRQGFDDEFLRPTVGFDYFFDLLLERHATGRGSLRGAPVSNQMRCAKK